jgi:MerR family transcriptional regulator, light-induced transcriptional regulator
MGYRIKTVSEILEVPRNTLLAWERRYGLVKPVRLSNGYREYSDQDVETLRALKKLVDSGYKVGEAVSLLREGGDAVAALEAEAPADALSGLRTALKDALLRFDRGQAVRLADSLATRPYTDRLHRVFFPILREIGTAWAEGSVTIAQEHYASGFVRERFMGMLMTLGSGPPDGPVALCASYPDDRHELGLMGLAIELALRGHRVSWFGADVPLAELIRVGRERRPDLVCVSVIQPLPGADIAAYATALRAALHDSTRIAIGGGAVDPGALPAVAGVSWAADISEVTAG